jgi:hypothetical protein
MRVVSQRRTHRGKHVSTRYPQTSLSKSNVKYRIGSTGHAFKDKQAHALASSSVRLYFPSEFGVDHYIHDFPHDEWAAKKEHFSLSSKFVPSMEVSRVYAGLFLEDSIGPWFGFDTKEGRYEAVGRRM